MSTAKGTNSAMILAIGTVIAKKWVILEFIGKGAMGEVYRAHQLNLQRDVAIKVVSRDCLQSFDEGDQEIETSLQRFSREVQAMAQIRHSNVLQIYDHGVITTLPDAGKTPVEYIVMEYIPGSSLRYTMSEEGFYPEENLLKDWLTRYFIPVLNGVEAVHLLDVTHRDLKPENILLDGEVPKIADFGLARSKRLKPVTQSMEMKGTLHYMSPEHFFDFRKADQRADIYSLGKIFFEAVSGKFAEQTTPFRQVYLPETETPFYEEIDNIIRNATAEKKEDRFESVAELRSRINNALLISAAEKAGANSTASLQARFWRSPKWIWTGVAVAVISMTAMTAWHLLGEPGQVLTDNQTSLVLQERTGPAATEDAGQPSDRLDASAAGDQPDFHENGAVLRSIPGGPVTLAALSGNDAAKQVHVAPFQIEEAPTTNHQYIEFLNSQLSTLTVARGVVRDENEIWLMLGEVSAGYEPIVFHNGRFHVNNAGYASYPVLRVTPYGASAYAAYYGRRLPTAEEWYQAVGGDITASGQRIQAATELSAGNTEGLNMEQMHAQMLRENEPKGGVAGPGTYTTPTPITSLQKNKYGVLIMGPSFGEWALQEIDREPAGYRVDSDVMLLPDGVIRMPWEAYENVGFRCVKPIGDAGTKPLQTIGTTPENQPPVNEGRPG